LKGFGDFDIDSLRYIVIDYTLTSNFHLLTDSDPHRLGKVWKNYHSNDRLLLLVNYDPAFSSDDSIYLDAQLQSKMHGLTVPHKENIRFIHIDDFIDIFDLYELILDIQFFGGCFSQFS